MEVVSPMVVDSSLSTIRETCATITGSVVSSSTTSGLKLGLFVRSIVSVIPESVGEGDNAGAAS